MKWALLAVAVLALAILLVCCYLSDKIDQVLETEAQHREACAEFDRHIGEALALSREVPVLNVAYSGDFKAWDAELAERRREWGAK